MPNILVLSKIQLFREGIRYLLEPHKDMRILDEPSKDELSFHSVLTESTVVIAPTFREQPIEKIFSELPTPNQRLKIILVACKPYPEQIYQALRQGVHGILDSSCASTHLTQAIRVISTGRIYVDEEIMSLMTMVGSPSKQWQPRPLSPREIDILHRLVGGQLVSQVANILGLSAKTVSTHKTHMMQKLSVNSFAELVQYAISHQIVEGSNEKNSKK
jgi:DNA-binding NarL/FixJ family response regulator